MSKIKTFGILSAITIFGLAGTVTAFWYVSAKSDERLSLVRLQGEMAARSASEPYEVATRQPMTIPLGAQTTKPSSIDPNTLQVASSSPTSTPARAQSQAPSATDFKSYDKYVTAESSLFGDILVGSGMEVTASSKVAVAYKGWLTNGTLFDETKVDAAGKLQPFVFQMGAKQVIPGWEQGIFGMKVGGKRRIIVPPAVGYGSAGQGPIPADSVLVFDVEVISAL